jgi:hypothetical protein
MSLTKNCSQLIAWGATIDNLIGILFDAYLVYPCHNFKFTFDTGTDGKHTAITHKALMTSAKRKFDWLKTKGTWGTKSPYDKKILAMTTALNALKGQLKLDPKLSIIAYKGKKGNQRASKRSTRRTHSINMNKKRMRCGRKGHQRTVKRRKSKLASTLTTGVSTTWHGPPTNLPIAS